MLVLSQNDVERLLPMTKCIDIMSGTLASLARGETILPLRTILVIPEGAFAVMPAYLAKPATIGIPMST